MLLRDRDGSASIAIAYSGDSAITAHGQYQEILQDTTATGIVDVGSDEAINTSTCYSESSTGSSDTNHHHDDDVFVFDHNVQCPITIAGSIADVSVSEEHLRNWHRFTTSSSRNYLRYETGNHFYLVESPNKEDLLHNIISICI